MIFLEVSTSQYFEMAHYSHSWKEFVKTDIVLAVVFDIAYSFFFLPFLVVNNLATVNDQL